MTPFILNDPNGEKPLVNVRQIENGWIVTVHNQNRDKEVSDETKLRREEEQKQKDVERKEADKARLRKEFMTQLASVKILSEAAGKSSVKGIDKEIDAWKYDEDDEEQETEELASMVRNPDKVMGQMEKVIEELVSSPSGPSWLQDVTSYPKTETYVFTDRQKMIEFVTQMLNPIIE